jgi:Tfp pilus assembly protein PilF
MIANGITVAEEDPRPRALELFEAGYRRHVHKDYEGAVRLYRRSLGVHPTAEAHTFLGWTYSHMNRVDDAIEECHKAINLDPEYGNPYNDIGVYLLSGGELDEAVPWFEKAKAAKRYEPRHYPYLNLGRIFLAQGMIGRALEEFRAAQALAPNDSTANRAVDEIRSRLN